MPTVNLKATKMSDATVSFISLVERGANRIPFKIVKKENHMAGPTGFAGLDLGSLFARKAEKPVQATVVGVITMKGDGLESVKSQLEAQGFSVSDTAEMEDGSVVFKQIGGDLEGAGHVVRVNDSVALITKGFNPYVMSMSMGDQSFEDVCKAQGFYPGIGTVMDVLRNSVMTLTEKSDDPKAAAEAVASMFDEARTYVSGMVGSLPSLAFKADGIAPVVAQAVKADETVVTEAAPTVPATTEPATAVTVETTEVVVEKSCDDMAKGGKSKKEMMEAGHSESDVDAAIAKHQAKKEDPLTQEQVSAIVASQVGSVVETLTKKMEEMMAGVTASVAKSLGDVTAQVEQVATVAKSASDTVAGIVVGGAPAGDHEPVVKTETRAGREIDTAYQPHVRKSARK